MLNETKPTYRRSYASCMSWLRTHILHHDVPHISTIFILLRLNPLGQRKLPIVISLSRMLCFGRVYASPCTLNVSAALQGAYRQCVQAEHVKSEYIQVIKHQPSNLALNSVKTIGCQPHDKCLAKHLKP